MRWIRFFLSVLFCVSVAGCYRRPPGPDESPSLPLEEVSPPDFQDKGDPAPLLQALDQSIRFYKRLPPDKFFTFGSERFSRDHMLHTLEDLRSKIGTFGLGRKFTEALRREYRFFAPPKREGLVTGYYEATLKGARNPSQRHRWPVYRKPPDILDVELDKFPLLQAKQDLPSSVVGREYLPGKVGPYFSRAEIDNGRVLTGRKLELAWVDDPIELFFLHIQGSGVIHLTDGSQMKINYAGKNGHPYKAIGQYLVEKGVLTKENVSLFSIRKALRTNPTLRDETFRQNPSYIFFHEVKEGPLGSLSVPVTPYRSIATDSSLNPKGAPALLTVRVPKVNDEGRVVEWESFEQLVFNQDTGGAIKGPGRVDLFVGSGKENELRAGSLKEKGRVIFFVKREGG